MKNDIVDNNKFAILNNEIFNNPSLSIDDLVDKFIDTSNSIAEDLEITSSTEIRKSMFHMSRNIYCLQRVKSLKYRQIKKSHLDYEPNQFIILVASYNKLCQSIHKKCNEFRRQNYLFWIKIGCEATFYLTGIPIPKTDCYTYLGVPFHKTLDLKFVISKMKNKVSKALFSIQGFLKN
ncbi:hypothetical protein BCR32DRAFT_330744, partial [Anaeromyces robustus]